MIADAPGDGNMALPRGESSDRNRGPYGRLLVRQRYVFYAGSQTAAANLTDP
jgi:hypothetical protein